MRKLTNKEEALRVRLSSLAKVDNDQAKFYRNKLVKEGLTSNEWNLAVKLVTSHY